MILKIFGVVFLVVVLFIALALARQVKEPEVAVNSFEECVAANYAVAESYPRTCIVPGGKTFTENIGNANEKADLIQLEIPQPNAEISSPLTVAGSARGNWYFEASFPVKLLDGNGKVIATAVAQAQGEWMTTNFVPFRTTLTFTKPETPTGTLVLEKDNPSGLPENDDSLRIPIKFN